MPEWRPREEGRLEELHKKMKQKKNRKHPERVSDEDIGVGRAQLDFKYQGACGNCRRFIKTNKAEFKGGYTGRSFGFYTDCPYCGWETDINDLTEEYEWRMKL